MPRITPDRQRRTLASFLAVCALSTVLTLTGGSAAWGENWPQWRGPERTGVSPAGKPPVQWSETENVRWKVAIPGRGSASPIVWGDQVFVLTAVPVAPAEAKQQQEVAEKKEEWPPSVGPTPHRFVVLALSRADGKVVWERTAIETVPSDTVHRDGTWASASPVTDGEHLFAHFGSQGLFAYDLAGKLLWQKDLGDMRTRNGFGEGSSPALHGDTLVVNWDHEGDSFIVALDKKTGAERWRRSRDEITSWSTPLVVDHRGAPQVIVSATGRSRGYNLATGEVIWEAAGMTTNVVPTPVHGDGIVYLTSGFRGNALQAIRLDAAKGDLATATGGTGGAVAGALVWSHDRHTPYVPSPLLYGDKLYFLKSNSGIFSCLDARSGEVLFTEERLDGVPNVYASPVGADGRVYVVGREGTTVVLRHADKPEVLARNTLDDGFDASPAIAGRDLFLRGREHLYCLSEASPAEPAKLAPAAR